MDANGNFKVEVNIGDLEALRATITSLTNEKSGLIGLVRQLKNGEMSLEDLFMNGNELRVDRQAREVRDNVPESVTDVPGGSLNGHEAAGENGIRGPAVPEQVSGPTSAKAGSKRGS